MISELQYSHYNFGLLSPLDSLPETAECAAKVPVAIGRPTVVGLLSLEPPPMVKCIVPSIDLPTLEIDCDRI